MNGRQKISKRWPSGSKNPSKNKSDKGAHEMRHRLSGRKLNRTSSHRKAMISNLAMALIKHEQIETTLPKAKELRSVVEKLITLGKKGGLHGRRKALSTLGGDTQLVEKIFTILSARYQERPGGYVRILKAGFRFGDNAPVAIIELVERDVEAKGLDSGPSLTAIEDDVNNAEQAA